jgi:dienelactone hydrolase
MSRHAAARATRLAPLPEDLLAGVRAVFLVYPYAGIGSMAASKGWRIAPRTTAIVCGRDSIVGKADPLKLMRRLERDHVPVATEFFPAATHSFDEADARDVRVCHDPELTRRALALYRALLRGAA